MPKLPMFEQGPSQIGRMTDDQGNEIGDSVFYERDMGITAESEAAALNDLQAHDADAALRQVEMLTTRQPGVGALAYTHLIQLYPNDPRVSAWREQQTVLAKKEKPDGVSG